jgi:hypothetical protein
MSDSSIQKPSVGRIVHYVLPSGPRKGEHRAAIVTGAWGGFVANLTVFLDQPNDVIEPSGSFIPQIAASGRIWSADYDAAGAPGSWHWPERE